MNVCFVIPARLKSTRLDKKMLIDFDGKPLIKHVYDNIKDIGLDTYVATDSVQIGEHIPSQDVLYTKPAANGTARISQLDLNYDYIINVQGDMIDINEETLYPIINKLRDGVQCLTAYTKGSKPDDVKVIHQNGKALWFTRSDIGYGDRHIGIYAYKKYVLNTYKYLLDWYPSENLEQNRILGHFKMDVVETIYNGKEINTQADIDSWSL